MRAAGAAYSTRTACASCGADGLPTVLSLGASPLADTFPVEPDATEVFYPLRLQWCRRCGLVQLADVVPDALLYGPDYGFSIGGVPAKVAEHRRQAAALVARFGDAARRLTVEIACNDGELLAGLAAEGCRVVGVDPAPRQAQVARDRGLDVHTASFGLAVAKDMVADYGTAGLIVANNVLGHVGDPNDFMAGVAALLGPHGSAVVQVQYVGDLIAGNEWDHVYHEHRSYFSLNALALLSMRHGLSVRDVTRSADQGGSLRVVLRHGIGYGDPGGAALTSVMRTEDWLSAPATYEAMQSRVDYCHGRIIDLVDEQREAGRTIAGYGASAKSCTLLNYCDITPQLVSHVVDKTPAKIGRYTPGTHLPIVGPGDLPHPDIYFHLAWNYLGWSLRNPDGFTGEWLVPVPFPVLL
jgi:SAM-dependent methyltransferase